MCGNELAPAPAPSTHPKDRGVVWLLRDVGVGIPPVGIPPDIPPVTRFALVHSDLGPRNLGAEDGFLM